MKEKFKRFKNEKIVINVRSQKQYDDFMKTCEEQGLKWIDGDLPTKQYSDFMKMCEERGLNWRSVGLPTKQNYYNKYKENTCISLNNLKYLYYCNITYYKNEGYEIITYKDFMKEENQDKFSGVKWYTNGKEVASCSYDGLLIQKNIEEKPVEILDEVEKKYLSDVIRPFKNKIIWIKKTTFYSTSDTEWIEIETSEDIMIFPNFKKGTMYKNMEGYKEYTLKELGL